MKNRTIKHYPRLHFSLPFRIKKIRTNDYLKETFTFTQPEYEVRNGVIKDQEDWNKLTGFKLKYFKPRENARMVGWRWLNGKVQICLYSHTDGNREFTEPLFELDKGDSLVVEISRTAEFENILTITHKDKSYSSNLFGMGNIWKIESWFGGTSTPDRKVIINVKY